MKWILALHFIAFAMGVGMSFSNFVNIVLARRLGGEKAAGLAALRGVLGRIGDVVIAMIWLTGILASAPYYNAGGMAAFPVAFHIKLVFVLGLTLCHIGARLTAAKIARTGNKRLIGAVQACTLGVFLNALAAIALAVAAFG